jgi:hypothetical protein
MMRRNKKTFLLKSKTGARRKGKIFFSRTGVNLLLLNNFCGKPFLMTL